MSDELERTIEGGRQFRLRVAKSPDELMNIALSANDLARIGYALRQLARPDESATLAARIRELEGQLKEERERSADYGRMGVEAQQRAESAEQRLEKVLKVARHYTKNYLLDEYNEPRLCVSKEQHDALTELFKATS